MAGAGGLNSHQFQLNQIHHHHHFDPLSSADDFLDQILSAVPPSSPWSSAAPDLIKPAWADSSSPGDDNVAAGFFDDPAAINVASKLRQQQLLMIAAGAPPSDQALFNGFGCIPSEPHLHHPTGQSFGAGGGQSAAAGQGQSQGKPKVRARRGQATDPHSIAERLRRERIAERMKALQELVPNGNKTDKASMLDEIIDYVKFLQLQVKVISMSRLGGAGAPLVANMSSKWGGGDCIQDSGGNGIVAGGGSSSSSNDGSLTMTEQQVAKLMEEDMGSAMQYLQGKGLCLMPISLATAISTATCPPGNGNHPRHRQQPSSPNVNGDAAVKDSTSATKP